MDAKDVPSGLSVWERDVYQLLVDHVAKESEVLGRYDDLLADSTGHVRFLLELIAEDEARHHSVFEQWAETFRGFATLVEPGPDGVPNMVPERDPQRLVEALEALLDLEKDDAKQLKDLEKRFKDFRHTTIWPLLAELMALDTQKHIQILEFLLDHAKQTARASSR
jgi:rubrerythrin